MKTTKLAHLGFEVQNMDDMLRFYCDGLGMQEKFIMTYDALLELIENTIFPEAPEEEKPGILHWKSQVEKMAGKKWFVYLELADRQFLELFYPFADKEQMPELRNHYGYQHYSLEVDDIHGMYQQLLERGYTPDSPPRLGPDFTYQFWVTDPDGNRLELMEYTDKSLQIIGNIRNLAGI